MNLAQLLRLRLLNQRLIASDCRTPLDLVSHLGAVQAQDYGAAKWAIGLRVPGVRDADVDAAVDSGALVRTHVLRPTWHFVAPADVRWMLALSAPRIRTAMGSYVRRRELDPATLSKSRKVIERALAGGRALTRADLGATLTKARLPSDGLRVGLMLIDAEIEALICSGPRRGKQITYALLDERVPPAKAVAREDSIAQLTLRYFSSHGPATLRDYVWWSGLTAKDARSGIEMCGSALRFETIGACTYWCAPGAVPPASRASQVHLLPNFDEFLVAYQDRDAITGGAASRLALSRGDLLSYRIVVNGTVVGTWKRAIGDGVDVRLTLMTRASRPVARALHAAADAYGAFLGRAVRCTIA